METKTFVVQLGEGRCMSLVRVWAPDRRKAMRDAEVADPQRRRAVSGVRVNLPAVTYG